MAGNERKTESARDGQKMRTEGAPDRSSHPVKDGLTGGSFKGGPTDLSHSLSGNKAHMDYQKK